MTQPQEGWEMRLRQLPQLYKGSKADIVAIESFIRQELATARRERDAEMREGIAKLDAYGTNDFTISGDPKCKTTVVTVRLEDIIKVVDEVFKE